MADALFSVQGQIVLVSGASRGIGRAIAQGFADRGATVIITGRKAETLEATAREICPPGGKVEPIVCDVADPRAIDQLVNEAMGRFGHVDTLVNVAGVNRRKRAENYTEEDYDFILDINLKGPFLLSVAVGRHMLQRGRGVQINIDSLNSSRPLKRVMPYAMSKAGISQMTRSLAMEWGDRGIRVNAIAPGFVQTELAGKMWEDKNLDAWRVANTPLQRIGRPADMVGTAIYLASEASAFMTGQILYVDGGTCCGLFWPIQV
jgi:gluconate 5-dehydrogenase